jgi:hypothetical protein
LSNIILRTKEANKDRGKHTMSNTSNITVDLTYKGKEPNLPRDFFIYIHNLPQDATIDIQCDGKQREYGSKERPPSPINEKGDSDIAIHITPDKAMTITARQGETIIGSVTYLVHDHIIFRAISDRGVPLIETIQIITVG